MQTSKKSIAIIGAGNVGLALAKGWSRVGHSILFGLKSTIHPNKVSELMKAIPRATVTTAAEAVRKSNVIVLAVPWDAVRTALADCGELKDRIIIDVTNPLKLTDGQLSLAFGFTTSGGEEVARLAEGAHVFKTLNQVGFNVMADANGYASPPTMFVAGEDGVDKASVLALVSDLGFVALDAGPLSVARLLEPYAMLWIHMVTTNRARIDSAFALQIKGD